MSCRPFYPFNPSCAPPCPPVCPPGPTGATGPASQQIAFSAVGLTGAFAVAAATTAILPFNYVLFQKGTSGSGFNGATNAFTVPITGLYKIGVSANATNTSVVALSKAQLNLVVNGTTLLSHNNQLATGQTLTVGFSDIVSLVAGQVVWVSATTDNGAGIAFSTAGQPPWTALLSVESMF